jgi:hypothetical protein
MKVYIIHAGNKLQIITVQPDQEDVFRTIYSDKIIVDGENISEALRKFHDLPISFPTCKWEIFKMKLISFQGL